MLTRGEDREPYDFPLAEVSPRSGGLGGGYETIGCRTLHHRAGKCEGCSLPLGEALGDVRRVQQLEALHRQRSLPPAVTARLDAPATAAQLGRQLADEKLDAGVERLGPAREPADAQRRLQKERAGRGRGRGRAAEKASRQTGKPGAQDGLRSSGSIAIATVP